METVTIKVGGMTCEGCVRSVTNALQDLPHIGAVEVSLVRGEAVIEHGPLVSEADIRQAIEDAGFEAA